MLKLSEPTIPETAILEVAEVLRSGQLVHGRHCNEFERELADYLQCEDTVLVSSGTAALHLTLLALDIGAGDAVIVPDFTFAATANCVKMAGATVVLADVDRSSYVISPDSLERAIQDWQGSERLKAVMPVHEFGYPADMSAIADIAARYGLAVIEDAACALGAECEGKKAGSLGVAGCFSFHPRKTLTTGEGGTIATDDNALAANLRLLRNHGMERSAQGIRFARHGLNYRMTDFQAVLGRRQLPELDERIRARRRLSSLYLDLLAPLEAAGLVSLPAPDPGHSWQTFMIVLNERFDRDAVSARLRERHIESGMGAQSMSSLGIYENYGPGTALPVGERLYRQGLALPFFEGLSEESIETVGNVLGTCLNDMAEARETRP